LLHGTPKTHYYWHRLVPRLSEEFTVVAPDLRGFGDSDRPVAEEGYDVKTNARDMGDLMSSLGHDEFHVHGEDRGAEFGYGSRIESRRSRSRRWCFPEKGYRSGRT
jgi:pimeloyl-ACP methyl ester carboxylesterase